MLLVLPIGGVEDSATVFANDRTDALGSYEIQAISVNGDMVTESRLSVISSQDLSGENITCSLLGVEAEAQETTVMVFGKNNRGKFYSSGEEWHSHSLCRVGRVKVHPP